MPPVRWKVFIVFAIYTIQGCYSQRLSESFSSITADGWRPIIGNSNSQFRQYPTEESTHRPATSTLQQRLPPLSVQHTPSTTIPTTSIIPNLSTPYHNKPIKIQSTQYGTKNKIPQGKFNPTSNQMFLMASHGKPHVIPLGTRGVITPPSIYRTSGMNKMPPHLAAKRPQKPIRMQHGSHSQKDEIFAQAPSSGIGTYTFFNQAPLAHRIRDNTGLSSTKFHIQQPHGHIEFTNHFGLKTSGGNEDIIQAQTLREIPSSQFLFQNPNDEFALNLVPPPLAKPFQDKPKEVKNLLKLKPSHIGESITNSDSDLLVEKQNLVLSGIPATYHQLNPNPLNNGNDQVVDFQITKEKFNVFHSNSPPNYESQKFVQFDNFAKRPKEPQVKIHNYEVTEGKWIEPYQSQFPSRDESRPHRQRRPQHHHQEQQNKPFLPTPLSPDGSNPTLPTQSEASSVYNLVSNKNNIKATLSPQFFNVKEISTHFPIIGDYRQESATKEPPEYSNEVIDNAPIRSDYQTPTQATETTTKSTNWENQRNRANQRRRRPGHRQRTTTETPGVSTGGDYDVQKTRHETYNERDETETPQTEKRQKQRPMRYRTTETPPTTHATVNHRTRQRPEEKRNKPNRYRVRPTVEDVREDVPPPTNHKMSGSGVERVRNERPTQETIQDYESSESMELNKVPSSVKTYEASTSGTRYQHVASGEEETDTGIGGHFAVQPKHQKQRMRHREPEIQPAVNYEYVESSDEVNNKYGEDGRRNKYEERELQSTAEPYSTDALPSTNLNTPENEVDYTTMMPTQGQPFQSITIKEIHKDVETTTLPTSTSTATESTTTSKTHRIKQRPNKYDNQQRPRFSVKEYRQRLQHATSTTTEASSRASTDSPRLRFPIRMRMTSTTTQTSRSEEGTESATDNPAHKHKFTPKDPRFRGAADGPGESTTEKTFKPVNPRLRPFGRQRSTTEGPSATTSSSSTTTTQRVSIKPFANLRKHPSLSLRTRIMNKNRANATDDKSTVKPTAVDTTEQEPSELPETTLFNDVKMETTTEMMAQPKRTMDVVVVTEASDEADDDDETVTPDILKSESFMQSQRVSDLTSSARKEYETPGLFKSVSPNSRRVPNYFTIATDDPRLPIEAFFPNLKSNNAKDI